MTSQQEYDYLLDRQKDLLGAVNEASVGARTTWLFYLALMAYFFIAVAGVTHQNLLLNTPVQLPFFGIGIDLTHFFLVAPIVFLLVQLGMLVQHIALHRKVCRFSQKLRVMENYDLEEGQAFRKDDADWLRFQVSSYFYTQRYAGPMKKTTIQALIILMYQVSFLLLPVVLLLFFQSKFIPYHDEIITKWARIYVVIGVAMLVGMRMITLGYESKTRRHNLQMQLLRAFSLLGGVIVSAGAIFASFLIFTIPDSNIDCVTRLATGKLYRTSSVKPIDVNWLGFVTSPSKAISEHGESIQRCRAGLTRRSAFFLTEYLSNRRLDPGTGRQVNFFDRNIHVTDEEIVKTAISITQEQGEDVIGIDNESVSLRDRNLRYATLDRSILKGADLTGADLKRASLRGTVLTKAKITCNEQRRKQAFKDHGASKIGKGTAGQTPAELNLVGCASLEGADLERANLTGAYLKGANFKKAQMNRAQLGGVFAVSANFSQAELSFANFNNANMPRANFEYANLTEASMLNAKLRFAQLGGAILSRAKMQGATLVLADLTGAHLKRADLERAQLTHAQLPGANLYGANLTKGDLSFAAMQGTDLRLAQFKNAQLNGTQLAGARAVAAKFHCADLTSTNLRGADLRGAIFYGAKLDTYTDIELSDLRFARYWQSKLTRTADLSDARNASGAVPSPRILLSMREDICRMRDYQVKPGSWGAKHQSRIEKVEKCVQLAKNSHSQSLEAFLKDVAQLDKGKPHLSGISYGCQHLESGLQNSDGDGWSTSGDLKNWKLIGKAWANPRAKVMAKKKLSQQLVELICTEKPYASYIAEGVIQRITERLASMSQPKNSKKTRWLTYQGDAGEFLTALESTNGCQKILKPLRKQLLWQLKMAVEIGKREKAVLKPAATGAKRAAR